MRENKKLEETKKTEKKIRKGMKIFIGALAGGFLGAILAVLWALMFMEADSFTDKLAGIEMLLISGTVTGGVIGGFFYKSFAIVAAALGWIFGMDLEF